MDTAAGDGWGGDGNGGDDCDGEVGTSPTYTLLTSAGNLFKIIFRASAERVQALPINLQIIYQRDFH